MTTIRYLLSRAMALVLLAAVAACGGGGGAATGVGSGGTGAQASSEGVAAGPVVGFGSVIVGDTRFDDGSATVTIEDRPGVERRVTLSQLRLGQQVTVGFTDDGTTARASTLRVEAEVVGLVTVAYSGSTGTFRVAGQDVAVNTDPLRGPVTLLDGFAAPADIVVNARVEVHGQFRSDLNAILATRVERKPTTDVFVRVAGTVSGLSGTTFSIGAITVNAASANVLPSGTALANGQRVVVWSSAALSGSTLTAGTVRVVLGERRAVQARVSGVVANCSGTCRSSFTVGGLSVDATSATFVNGNLNNLVNGAFVRVRGTFNATTGRVIATSVTFKASGETEVEAKGAINDFASTSFTDRTFTVRGVPVTTNNLTQVVNCGATVLANGVLVKVEGTVSNNTVTATRVSCLSSTEIESVEVEAKGSIVGVTTGAQTFTVDTLPGLTVRWTSNTVFETGFSSSNLAASAYVEVKGQVTNGVLVAREIDFENAPGIGELEIRGVLFGYAGGPTFQVGALTINVNGQTIPSGFVNGATVKVKYVVSGGQNNAIEIRLDD